MNLYKIILFTTIFSIVFSPFLCYEATAQNHGNIIIEIPKMDNPIELDGNIGESEWNNARKFTLTQMHPNFGNEPTEETQVLIGYSDEYLYAACRCYDTEPVSAASFRRDYSDADSDLFGLVLDTYNDNENATIFFTSPTAHRADAAVSNDASGFPPFDPNWDTFWDVEVHRNDNGWFAEMRIPISSLRFDDNENGQVIMGVSAVRFLSRENEFSTFPIISPQWGYYSFLKPSQTQEAKFDELEPKLPLQVKPYILGGLGQQHLLNDEETVFRRDDDITYDAGLDIKLGLTSNLTLDLTVNTDFAQVEADNQQINLTRFPLFFPEKRKFFQERSSNFDFNFSNSNRLFYSRRIGLQQGSQVRILGGARLVGRSGPWDIGVLSMQTAREPNIGQTGNTLPSENFSVARFRRQVVNDYSYVGGIFTNRINRDGSYNTAYGFDGIFRVSENQYISAKWAQTFDERTDSRLNSLSASRMQLRWEGRNYQGLGYNFRYDRAGENYIPGIGFELREDYYRLGDRISYGWINDEDSWFQRHRINMTGTAYYRNTDGSLQSLVIGPEWELVTRNNHDLVLSISRRTEDLQNPFFLSENVQIPADRYHFHAAEINYSMPSSWDLRTSAGLGGGQFFDGQRRSFYLGPTWNVSRFLKLNGYYEYNRLNFEERDDELTTHIGRFRVEITPNVKYSISSFIQYNSSSDLIIGNLRLRYNPKEGNDLYIVYNERLNSNRSTLSGPDLPISNSRAILIKYNYTFRW